VTLSPEPPGISRFGLTPAGRPWAGGLPVGGPTRRLQGFRLVMDVFLQILSAGRFTVATGETLDLSNYIVVATSNIGSRVLMESRSTDSERLSGARYWPGQQISGPRHSLVSIFNAFLTSSITNP
jgi:AAA domain (Cdc48 subfamily)